MKERKQMKDPVSPSHAIIQPPSHPSFISSGYFKWKLIVVFLTQSWLTYEITAILIDILFLKISTIN